MTPEEISQAIDDIVDNSDNMTLEEFDDKLDAIFRLCVHKFSLGRCKHCGMKTEYERCKV